MPEKRNPNRVRAHYLTVSQYFNLDHACRWLTACGFHTYIVGSVLHRPDFRDVDLRCIMMDAEFDAFLGKIDSAKHRLLNTVISEWLASRTGLPIDFQFQRMTEANRDFSEARNFIGVPIEMRMSE